MRIFRSLRAQLALVVLLSLLVPVSVIGYFTIKYELDERSQTSDNKNQLIQLLNEVQPLFSDLERGSSEEDLTKLLPQIGSVMSRYPGIRTSFYNGSANYQFSFGNRDRTRIDTSRSDAIVVSIPDHARMSVLDDVITNHQELTILLNENSFFGMPIIEGYLPVGANKQCLLIANARMGPFLLENRSTRNAVSISLLIGLMLGICGILLISQRLHKRIKRIKAELAGLSVDLTVPLAEEPGELGLIVEAVNNLRQVLDQKRQLEQKLLHAERLAGLGQVVAGVAHEIRNPLGIIKGTVQLMERKAANDDSLAEYKEHLQIISEQIRRQNNVVEELLSYARPIKPQMGPVALQAVLDSVLTFLSSDLNQQKIILEKEIDSCLPTVYGDGEKLKQVFVNLLLNAKEVLPQGGLIRLKAYLRGETVIITISDNGEGIPEQELPRVFEPFFSTKEAGTGLGLSIAKQLVELNTGTISVDSKLGFGTTFTVMIPVGGDNNAVNPSN